jgi:3-dehydroquinate dehydratase-2
MTDLATLHVDINGASLFPRYSFVIMNGPNLAHIGQRQPEIYGSQGLDCIPAMVQQLLGERTQDVALSFFQSNSEGQLIDRMEQAKKEGSHGIVFNAGAYTHTSLAIADCIAWVGLPVVEVHISNVLARAETVRRRSYMGVNVVGVISGFGIMSYALAVQALSARLHADNKNTAHHQ